MTETFSTSVVGGGSTANTVLWMGTLGSFGCVLHLVLKYVATGSI